MWRKGVFVGIGTAAIATALLVLAILGPGVAQAAVATTASPIVSSITVSGSVMDGQFLPDPTVTIAGTGFGKNAWKSLPTQECSGTTGSVFGKKGLWIADGAEWTAGQFNKTKRNQQSDCIGLVLSQFSPKQIVFTFGSDYNTGYSPIFIGDSLSVQVKKSAVCTATLNTVGTAETCGTTLGS